jgi:adenylyl-sulfate kinase
MKSKDKNKGFVLWLTGLPCAGKTTIGDKVYKILKEKGFPVVRLDGDTVRKSINKNLGFSKKDRGKNLEIVSSMAKPLSDQGNIVIASFISPYKGQREKIRKKIKNFIEIFVNASLEACENRDKKGLYKKARLGKIKNFTGVSDPYEPPVNPDLELKTDKETISQSVNRVIDYLFKNGYLK